jgi:hypothetical protein
MAIPSSMHNSLRVTGLLSGPQMSGVVGLGFSPLALASRSPAPSSCRKVACSIRGDDRLELSGCRAVHDHRIGAAVELLPNTIHTLLG